MPTSCECDDIVVENCPPYLSVETFVNYTEKLCSNCTAIDETTGEDSVDKNTYVDYFDLDPCCPVLTVYKGSQIIYSFDGGLTWVETGTAQTKATTTLGSTLFTAGVLVIPNITTVNTVLTVNERNAVDIYNNRFRIKETGNYLITFDVSFIYTAASNMYMALELLESGVTMNPRQAQTMLFNGANPTELSASRWMRLTTLKRFNASNALSIRFYPLTTGFTSGTTNIYTNIIKLSS